MGNIFISRFENEMQLFNSGFIISLRVLKFSDPFTDVLLSATAFIFRFARCPVHGQMV